MAELGCGEPAPSRMFREESRGHRSTEEPWTQRVALGARVLRHDHGELPRLAGGFRRQLPRSPDDPPVRHAMISEGMRAGRFRCRHRSGGRGWTAEPIQSIHGGQGQVVTIVSVAVQRAYVYLSILLQWEAVDVRELTTHSSLVSVNIPRRRRRHPCSG